MGRGVVALDSVSAIGEVSSASCLYRHQAGTAQPLNINAAVDAGEEKYQCLYI